MTWTDEDLQRVLQRGQVHMVGQPRVTTPLPDDMMVDLTLPWPPSVDALYKPVRGRFVLSEAGREYYHQVGQAILTEWPRYIARPLAREWRLGVHIFLYPLHYRYDVDNRIKAILDSLQHAGVYANDKQVRDIHIQEGPLVEVAHIRVMLRRLS